MFVLTMFLLLAFVDVLQELDVCPAALVAHERRKVARRSSVHEFRCDERVVWFQRKQPTVRTHVVLKLGIRSEVQEGQHVTI